MSRTVAMYDKSYEYIGKRLDALGLDIEVATFDQTGNFTSRGVKRQSAEVDVDYMWLSSHLNADNFRDQAFDIVLKCKSVGILQTFNAGLDHPFYKKISDKGTRVCNSSAQGVAIAEYTLGQVLSVLQPIEQQRAMQAAKKWQITPFRELSQTNWLIIGFGPIGREIATRVKAFGATTSVIRRAADASPLADKIGTMADLGTMLPDADVVVLACALNDATRGFAGEAFFSKLKPGTILVNIARGALIDDMAMLAALDRDRLATAILDVFHQEPLPTDNPLWTHPKVRLTSHTSFSGSGARGRSDALFLDNITRFANGRPLVNEVNPRDIV
jgi:phosphoglycerate dehydrogenase-like enzyme